MKYSKKPKTKRIFVNIILGLPCNRKI